MSLRAQRIEYSNDRVPVRPGQFASYLFEATSRWASFTRNPPLFALKQEAVAPFNV